MVEIFGFDERKKFCPSCINAKKYCQVKNIPYTFHSVNDEGVLDLLLSRMDRKDSVDLTMPQIFEDYKHIGGFSEFKKSKK